MRPNTPATEKRGRKEGQGAAFMHVSRGQIIYHLVQTNSVLSEEEKEGFGLGARGGGRSVRAAGNVAA